MTYLLKKWSLLCYPWGMESGSCTVFWHISEKPGTENSAAETLGKRRAWSHLYSSMSRWQEHPFTPHLCSGTCTLSPHGCNIMVPIWLQYCQGRANIIVSHSPHTNTVQVTLPQSKPSNATIPTVLNLSLMYCLSLPLEYCSNLLTIL